MIGPYRILEGAEEQAVIDDLVKRIPTLHCAGTVDRWEKGWAENLEAYKQSGDIADLRPKYIRRHQPLRYDGKFIIAEDPDAEAKWYDSFFAKIIQRWMLKYDEIWEYGCGSGHNIATLARAFPSKRIVGADWAKASGEIVIELNKRYHNAWPAFIDFFDPTPERPGDASKAAIFTVGALEQTGDRWVKFLNYLLNTKPAICVHIEPVAEWYDRSNPVDQTAIAAHDARGFWRGFPLMLKLLQERDEIEILHMERTGFGSLWIEGYSQIVWRPR